jgi:alpha-tubulin suppressor-like RCC1 family protein
LQLKNYKKWWLMSFRINTTVKIDGDQLTRLNSGATGSRPAAPTTGMMFFNTTSGKIEVWNGAAWKESVSTSSEIPSAWAWGSGSFGRLGDTTTSNRSSPVSVVGGFTDWVQISGGQHTAAIRANGTAWAWGRNDLGQLGNGTTSLAVASPNSVVGGFTDWVQISAGGFHTAAIRANGTAWAWGRNDWGQLGNGTTSSRSSPVSVVGGFTDWVQISAGWQHTAAIRANGTAWAWGLGSFGRLGDGTTTNKSSPVSVVGGFTDWVQISCYGAAVIGGHTAAIRANGTAWAWGFNGNGELGNGTISSYSSPVSVVGGFTDWVQIAAGGFHTVAIRANGTAWAWGANSSGRLGDGTTTNKSSPVSVVGGFTDWVQIAAGRAWTVAIRANGTAWAWGYNGSGQLGDGTTSSRLSPVSVVGGFTDWVQIGALYNHTAALRSQPKYKIYRR